MMKCVIPLSGGLDSTVMLFEAAFNKQYTDIFALSFSYGQRHKTKELTCAANSIVALKNKYANINFSHKVFDLSFFKDIAVSSSITNHNIPVAQTKDVLGDPQPVNYVPFRNLMMLSILCSFAEAHEATDVYYGSALVDSQAGYWDSSKEFYQNLDKVVGLNRKNKINIKTPLITLDKKDIISLGNKVGVDFANTWTCYEGLDKACGYCPACSSRIKGFIDVGIADPIPYSREINFIKY